MTVGSDPGQAEVLGWMARTGGTAADAVEHFFPGIAPEAKARVGARFRKWLERARADGTMPASMPAPKPQGQQARAPTTAQRPPPDLTFARLPPLERLERQVAELAVDLQLARSVGDLRTALQIDQQLAERAAELDAHRARAAKVLRLDRSVGAVAAELAKKSKAIELRAEMERRRLERAAQAAAQQAKEREL